MGAVGSSVLLFPVEKQLRAGAGGALPRSFAPEVALPSPELLAAGGEQWDGGHGVPWDGHRWEGSSRGGGSVNNTLACREKREVVALQRLEMSRGVQNWGKSA